MKHVITLLFLNLFIMIPVVQAQFANGSGTEEAPYEVATLEQLQEVGNHLDAHFILTADIDAMDTESWNEGKGFIPIGSEDFTFTGSFDGNSYAIENLTILREDEDRIGLFGVVNGIITNALLENVNITGDGRTGGLAGEIDDDGEIYDSHISGEVSGNGRSGGLAGENWGIITASSSDCNVSDSGGRAGGLVGSNRAEIHHSFSSGAVSSEDRRVGGLVGHNRAIITTSSSQSNVTATGERVGGLVGYNSEGEVHDSHASGNVSAGESGGGLIGENEEGVVSNSYATGDVSGSIAGGLVGDNNSNSIISTSYSTGEPEGAFIGGLIGSNSANIESSYWDIESSGQAEGAGGPMGTPEGASGLTTNEMTGVAAYGNMTGFDFDDLWLLTENYPALYWEDVEALEQPDDSDIPAIAILSSPENGSEGVSIPVNLNWQEAENAETYNLQISIEEDFSNLIIDVSGIEEAELLIEDETLFDPMTTYYWHVQSVRNDLTAEWSELWTFQTEATANSNMEENIPKEVHLEQNFPNPFNPLTSIEYGLPEASDVKLEIYDILGRRVATLVNGLKQPGTYHKSFDAMRFSSGVYIYRLQAGEIVKIRQMMLVK